MKIIAYILLLFFSGKLESTVAQSLSTENEISKVVLSTPFFQNHQTNVYPKINNSFLAIRNSISNNLKRFDYDEIQILDTTKANEHNYDRGVLRIFGEIAIGNLIGLPLGFLSGFIAHSATSPPNVDIMRESWGTSAILTGACGHIIGSSFGVYIIAKGGNKDLSFWPVLFSGTIGGLIGYLPVLIAGPGDIGFLAILGPVIGAVIYANTIGYPSENNIYSSDNHYNNLNSFAKNPRNFKLSNSLILHRDLYNHDLILYLNFLKIDL